MSDVQKDALLSKHIISHQQLRSLCPDSDEFLSADAWDKIPVQRIHDVMNKLGQQEILFVENSDGTLCPRLKVLSSLFTKLFQYGGPLFGDYSVAATLAHLFEYAFLWTFASPQYSTQVSCDSTLRSKIKLELENIIVQTAWLLNEDMRLFLNAFKNKLSHSEVKQKHPKQCVAFYFSFAQSMKRYFRQHVEAMDMDLTQDLASVLEFAHAHGTACCRTCTTSRTVACACGSCRGTASLLPMEVHVDGAQVNCPSKNKFVLITTSNGGGCHLNIAKKIRDELYDGGTRCCIVNESKLGLNDVLGKNVGIDFTQLYPVLFQKLGKEEHRQALSKLNSVLTTQFLPSNRHAKMRRLLKELNQSFGRVTDLYSTQHYKEDARSAPENANVWFQVCDFGPIDQLYELGMALACAGEVSECPKIKFLVPSESCLLNKECTRGCVVDFAQHCVLTKYPVNVLDDSEADRLFNGFAKTINIDSKVSLQCVLMVGAQGGQNTIVGYLEKIQKSYECYVDRMKMQEKYVMDMDLLVVCGRNEQLLEELRMRYKMRWSEERHGIGPVRCLNVIPVGFVPNKELIAFCKKSVLITKPGGGTVAECIDNEIECLLVSNPNASWEVANICELERHGLGRIIVEVDDIMKQIIDANDNRINRQLVTRSNSKRRKVRLHSIVETIELFYEVRAE